MIKIEHIGIAVNDLDAANKTYESLLGAVSYKTEIVESEKVATSFFKLGETKIELLKALSDESAIARFISKRGEGIHHIAIHVDNITNERSRLINEGFDPIGDIKKGADNKLVCFFHPKTAHGVLIELCQEII